MTGCQKCKMFEVKPKKQLTQPSAFPKKKQHYKMPPTGSMYPMYFVTDQEPEKLFEIFVEEIGKFQDPVILPD